MVVGLLLAACSNSSSSTNDDGAEIVAATLRLDIDNCGGLAHQRATAVRIKPDLAATVAHPFLVDGDISVEELTVVDAQVGGVGADIVFLDAETDVALLRLDSDGSALDLADFEGDHSARFTSYSTSNDRAELRDLEILRAIEVTLDGKGNRQGLELAGIIIPGDSGSPVIDDEGQVIGIIFATSRTNESGWAIAASEYVAAMAQPEKPIKLSCS